MEGTIVLRERLASQLKSIREKYGWTQEHAAELCGLSPRFWRKLELGRAAASVDTLEKLSLGLHMGVGELLQEEGGAEPALGTGLSRHGD